MALEIGPPSQTTFLSNMLEVDLLIKYLLSNYDLCLVDIEFMLNGEKQLAPTFCVSDDEKLIPLNTPDRGAIWVQQD